LHQRLPLGLIYIDNLKIESAVVSNLPPDRFSPAARWAPVRYQ
jgi:hypothetical protein